MKTFSRPLPRFAALPVLALMLGLWTPVSSATTKPIPVTDPAPEIIHTASGITEVGTLASVAYRIDIPASWLQNPRPGLVVYFHGYSEGPFVYHANGPLNEQTQPIFDRGYAIIQSAYSTSGWALAEAFPETEQLRQYFITRYGQPAVGKKAAKQIETFVAGGSMGGALVAATLELNPKPFAGGLDLCGSVGPTDLAFQRRFAWRAAFDFYFPGVMPGLVPSPPDYKETRALRHRAEEAMQANPAAAAAIRGLTQLHTDQEVANDMVYFTYVIADMQHRAGGNPFDNRNFLYTGTSPSSTVTDNALDDGVRRYAADPHARDYLIHHYTPSGRLTRPMLAVHTTYDPVVPPASLAFYAEQVAIAGLSQNLVQQYVRRDGHCAFTAEEVGRAFDELLAWVQTGHRPSAGALTVPHTPGPSASTTH